jgi:hypothetical protein
MRNFIVAVVAAGAILNSTGADAADNWTGFYVGANLGWSFGDASAPVGFTSTSVA